MPLYKPGFFFQIIIIGAGPAGIAAAIQLKRANVNFVVFEKNKPGGLIRNANLISNYPGFGGISGHFFAEKLTAQLNQLNIFPLLSEAEIINFEDDSFICRTSRGIFRSRYLIYAAGTEPNLPQNYSIPADCKHLVFSEISSLPWFENRENLLQSANMKIMIAGSGDAAFDYALNLQKNCNIEILIRNSEVKALPLLQNEFLKKDGKIRFESEICRIRNKNDKLEICLTNGQTYYADFLLNALGRKPAVSALGIPEEKLLSLKNQRFFTAGDVKNGKFRQVAISVGDGMKAAMNIIQRINHEIN